MDGKLTIIEKIKRDITTEEEFIQLYNRYVSPKKPYKLDERGLKLLFGYITQKPDIFIFPDSLDEYHQFKSYKEIVDELYKRYSGEGWLSTFKFPYKKNNNYANIETKCREFLTWIRCTAYRNNDIIVFKYTFI